MRHRVLLFAAGLAVVSGIETARALLAGRAVATPEEWQAATSQVRANLQPEDLIVFAPRWADPIGRLYLGDRIPVEMAARADAARYRRIWEVSLRGAQAPEAVGSHPVSTTHHGRIRVTLYQKVPIEVAYDFTSQHGRAHASEFPTDGRGNEVACYSEQSTLHCPETRVEPRILTVDFQPRRGLEFSTSPSHTTRLEFPEARLGKVLIIYTGASEYDTRKHLDAPIHIEVSIDGFRLSEIRHAPGNGWQLTSVDTSRWAGVRHVVRFEVAGAPGGWRNLGLHAEARP